jgi:hypothetical protein
MHLRLALLQRHNWSHSVSTTISINGIDLSEVKMLMEPTGQGGISYLTIPSTELRVREDGHRLRLAIPATLIVELYRQGILPQAENAYVDVSIGGRSAGRFVIVQAYYPSVSSGIYDYVTLVLDRSPQADHPPAKHSPSNRPRRKSKTYMSDLAHYLDEAGELAEVPLAARNFGRFLTVVVDATTGAFPACDLNTRIPCRRRSCQGTIRATLVSRQVQISWSCPICGDNGLISNWQATKWNQLSTVRHRE